jgi:integrase/recombinase XerD
MSSRRKARGIAVARGMRHRRKGGCVAAPSNLDRTHQDTLASRGDAMLEHLIELNYSATTVRGMKWALRVFLEWAQERELRRPDQVTKPILESYQRWLFRYRTTQGKPLSVSSQLRYLGVVQRLFAWLCRNNWIIANPAADLELPRKQRRFLPRALSQEEVWKLLALPDISDPLGVRDRAILELFYSTGLRRSEVVKLDLQEIVPLGERTLAWIERYREQARPLLEISSQEQALFLTGFGGRYNPEWLTIWLRKLLDQIGVTKEGSCHLLRHSCATHMLEGGADIRYIQQMLGHNSLETTQIYTQVDIRQLSEVHARTHPAAKLPSTTESATE